MNGGRGAEGGGGSNIHMLREFQIRHNDEFTYLTYLFIFFFGGGGGEGDGQP